MKEENYARDPTVSCVIETLLASHSLVFQNSGSWFSHLFSVSQKSWQFINCEGSHLPYMWKGLFVFNRKVDYWSKWKMGKKKRQLEKIRFQKGACKFKGHLSNCTFIEFFFRSYRALILLDFILSCHFTLKYSSFCYFYRRQIIFKNRSYWKIYLFFYGQDIYFWKIH